MDTIIGTAAGFDDRVFQRVNELIQKPTSTDPSDADLKELSKSTGVMEDDLRYFLSFLAFLYAQTSDIPDGELTSTLVSFLAENGEVEDVETLASKLSVLLVHRAVQDAAAKKARLRDGLLPNIVNLANYVDLRSDFKRHDDGTLTGELGDAVSIIQLGIRTNSADPHERELVLQLDERSLGKLEECIKEIRKKLEVLAENDD
ncbi:hypothetical protein [Sulfitobacter mediterraneus]|uniref:hypothetical protein n=1 Tax=Sulfitobacter mediterraneus TaxID=83219 RepID=UPI0021A6ABE2|nr:hypothetical protein [Sulfitobacter mediterraneus]UWR10627.1 hypothetical protein K3753_15440 [Sulfitobacter mediterraneus]